jgi:hypothetical protein
MPSPADPEADSDGADDGLEGALGRLGDLLWLTSVGVVVAALAVVAFLAAAGAVGRLSPALGIAVLLLGLLGALYVLFGNGDWSTGGEARQHATFLVLLVGVQALVHTGLRTLAGGDGPSGLAAFGVGVAGIALAGWLAYLGGVDRLTSLPR